MVKIAVGTILIRNWPALGRPERNRDGARRLPRQDGMDRRRDRALRHRRLRVHGEATDPGRPWQERPRQRRHARRWRRSVRHAKDDRDLRRPGDEENRQAPWLQSQGRGAGAASKKQRSAGREVRSAVEDGGPSRRDPAEAKVPFYQRGDKLVRPVVLPVETFHGKTTSAAQLVEVDLPYLRDMLCRKSRWVKLDRRGAAWVEIHPPAEAAIALLKRFGDWKFPIIAGIITTPTLRPDGTILSTPGYDPATKLLLIDPPPMPDIPDNPTKDDALAALNLLKDLLVEFPFVDEVSRVGGAVGADLDRVPRRLSGGADACDRRAGRRFRQELSALYRQLDRHRPGHAGARRGQERGGIGKAARRRSDHTASR